MKNLIALLANLLICLFSYTQKTNINPIPTDSIITESINNEDNDSIYLMVDEMPLFKNKEGINSFRLYALEKVRYPIEATENNFQGTVYVQFIINKQGKLTNAKIIQSVHKSIDKEVLRVVNSSPIWEPGKHKGKVVNVQYTMPIKFSM